MERGMGGRIEMAFATAKERGEAAFVSFVTAGYPSAKGRLIYIYIYTYFTTAVVMLTPFSEWIHPYLTL
jgi:hypothetical protein